MHQSKFSYCFPASKLLLFYSLFSHLLILFSSSLIFNIQSRYLDRGQKGNTKQTPHNLPSGGFLVRSWLVGFLPSFIFVYSRFLFFILFRSASMFLMSFVTTHFCFKVFHLNGVIGKGYPLAGPDHSLLWKWWPVDCALLTHECLGFETPVISKRGICPTTYLNGSTSSLITPRKMTFLDICVEESTSPSFWFLSRETFRVSGTTTIYHRRNFLPTQSHVTSSRGLYVQQ